jgi:hypothetical protein
MSSSLNVGALIVRGSLTWSDATTSSTLYLCAGYIAVETSTGRFDLNVINKKAFIYIKNNNMLHASLRTRGFGSVGGGAVFMSGRPMTRTWSLLSASAFFGDSTISLLHDATDMGWLVGDRITIAPTGTGMLKYTPCTYMKYVS